MLNFFKNIFFNSRALFYGALFIFLCNFSFTSILPNINNKCIWIPKENLLDTASVDFVFDFINKNNIDKVFLQIRSRGDALYQSDLVPKYENLSIDFDPLNYFLEKNIHKNVEIHAWLNTYILWSGKSLPKDSLHFYYKCPDCLESDFNGKSDKNIILTQYQSKNWEGVYLSPTHPEVNNHLLNVIDELTSNYDLDGIHLDYIRYQDSFYGYNKEGLNNFISKYNYNPKDINRGLISPRFGYSKDYVDSLKSNWNNYRINKITELVRSLKFSILDDSLDIQLSAAVKPNYYESKQRWYQDWSSWIKEDLIDFVVIMNYNSEFSDYNFYNDQIIDEFSYEQQKNKIYIGISCYNQNPEKIVDKIFFSRIQGYENFSLFPYDFQKDTLNWYNPIFNVLNFNLY